MFQPKAIERCAYLVAGCEIDREVSLRRLVLEHCNRGVEAAPPSVLIIRGIDQEPVEPGIKAGRVPEPR